VIAPSGEQITITAGDQQAVVVEVGGGLRSYSASGREFVDGYRADEMSSSGRGQVLIRGQIDCKMAATNLRDGTTRSR
jgi:aldose 1-epimerase